MKMRLVGFLAFALLSISILSYGVNGSVFADSHNIAPVTVTSDVDIIANGGNVKISGNIKNYDASSITAGAVTYVIITPDEKGRVGIGQLLPKSDGSFEFSFVAGGPLWKTNGDYIVEVKYGADKNTTIINYVGGEPVVSTPPPPPPVDTTPPPPPPVDTTPPPPPPVDTMPPLVDPKCGKGTVLENGICVLEKPPVVDDKPGCLIATATYGTELAPQVQLLREIRDNTLFSTSSGTTFMSGFNTIYYSFAPTVSDWERENPMFKEMVKTAITPMLSTLSIMSLANEGSEAEVLGLGISVITLNLGMYIAAPALVGFKVSKYLKSRK
jgi:hypothetical protein